MSWIYQYNQPISNFHHMCTRYAYIQQIATVSPTFYIQPYIQLTLLGIYPPINDHISHCIHPTLIHHLYIHLIHPTILAHAIIPYIHPIWPYNQPHISHLLIHISNYIYPSQSILHISNLLIYKLSLSSLLNYIITLILFKLIHSQAKYAMQSL